MRVFEAIAETDNNDIKIEVAVEAPEPGSGLDDYAWIQIYRALFKKINEEEYLIRRIDWRQRPG